MFGLVSVYLRRFLEETPIFKEMAQRKKVAKELPVKTVLREHRPAMPLVALMTWVPSTTVVVVILMTPAYLQKVFHIAPTLSLEANVAATLTLTIGCAVCGWATDRIGTKAVMLIGWGGLAVTSYLFYMNLPGTPESLVWLYALVGFFCGSISLLPITGVRAFPPAIRFSGLSFAYNMAYAVFGGLTPIIISVWQNTT